MSAGEIIERTLSDGCACRRWHACISSVSLHREENRLAHEQKPNNSSSRWKGSPFGEVGWLRDSGNRLAISCTTLLVRTSFDRVMAQHESTQRVSRATWPRPMPQFLRWRQKNLIWITLLSLSLSRRAFSETFLTGPVENPVSTVWPFLLSWNLHRFYQLNKEECPIFGPCKSRKGNLDTSSLPRGFFFGPKFPSSLPKSNVGNGTYECWKWRVNNFHKIKTIRHV